MPPRQGSRSTPAPATCGPALDPGPADGDAATPFLLDQVQSAYTDGAQAIVIACFDDTGLSQARLSSPSLYSASVRPAFHAAMMLGHHYSVVTTLSSSPSPVIVANIHDYGVGSHCMNVRASEVPVLDLERPALDAGARFLPKSRRHPRRQRRGYRPWLRRHGRPRRIFSAQHGVPVIDGVAAASGFAQTLCPLKGGH